MKRPPVNTILSPLLLSGIMLLSYCHGRGWGHEEKKGPSLKTDTLPALYKKPPASFNDTIIIKGLTAVFFNPDSAQLQKIKAIRGKMNFESDTHDCFFQMRNARMVLKQYWPRLKVIETSKARFLLFIFNEKSKQCIDLNAKNDMCGIFLFNGKKEPLLIDMMNIDTVLDDYFKR